MQFTSFAILAISAVASARVARRDDSSATGASKGATCAKGGQISCCTTNTSSDSGLLGNVLGGSCALNGIPLLNILNNNCPAVNTFCCPSNQDGTLNINLSCIPVTL